MRSFAARAAEKLVQVGLTVALTTRVAATRRPDMTQLCYVVCSCEAHLLANSSWFPIWYLPIELLIWSLAGRGCNTAKTWNITERMQTKNIYHLKT